VNSFNGNSQLSGCFALTEDDQFLRFINNRSPKKYKLNQGKIESTPLNLDDKIPF
jgi:hypothetical protein